MKFSIIPLLLLVAGCQQAESPVHPSYFKPEGQAQLRQMEQDMEYDMFLDTEISTDEYGTVIMILNYYPELKPNIKLLLEKNNKLTYRDLENLDISINHKNKKYKLLKALDVIN